MAEPKCSKDYFKQFDLKLHNLFEKTIKISQLVEFKLSVIS